MSDETRDDVSDAVRAMIVDALALSGQGVLATGVTHQQGASIAQGVAVLAAALDNAQPRAFSPRPLPIAGRLGPAATPLGRRFRELAPTLPWTVARQDPDGERWALVVFGDMFDLGAVEAGLVVSLPDGGYPQHSHPPQEFYTVLEGAGAWRYGGRDQYVDVEVGQSFYNPPNGLHGLRTANEAVVAMYTLWN